MKHVNTAKVGNAGSLKDIVIKGFDDAYKDVKTKVKDAYRNNGGAAGQCADCQDGPGSGKLSQGQRGYFCSALKQKTKTTKAQSNAA